MAEGHVKDKEYVAKVIIDAINASTVAPYITQVITDNACRGSWPIIMNALPWITCSACLSHSLDLLLEVRP